MRQQTSSQQQNSREQSSRDQSASSDAQRSIPTSDEGTRRGNQSAVQRSGGQDGRGRALQRASSLLPTPWALMRRLSEELEQLVDNGGAATPADIRVPAMEVIERPDAIVVRADLPGSTPDDIEVTVRDNVLTISGERRQESREEHGGVVRSEVTYGSFARSIVLPDGADPENVKASFHDGVLEVSVPVAGARDRGKRIDVQSDR